MSSAAPKTVPGIFWHAVAQLRPKAYKARWMWGLVCIALLCFGLPRPEPLFADDPPVDPSQQLVTLEINYDVPAAGEVFLVWAIDGWTVPPEHLRPPESKIRTGNLHTPMIRKDGGSTFQVKIQVPVGTVVNFGFVVSKTDTGRALFRWDTNNFKYYHVKVENDQIINTISTLDLVPDEEPRTIADIAGPFVTLEIRYRIAHAGQVFLVWGIDGWGLAPEESRPAGTIVKQGAMHTPMLRDQDDWVAQVQVLKGTTVEYGLLTTQTEDGTTIEPIWDRNPSYNARPMQDHIAEIEAPPPVAKSLATSSGIASQWVTQEIRYYMPEASEVHLVWGVNGWRLLPDDQRPTGTAIKNDAMQSPMTRTQEHFLVSLTVPAGTAIQYGFLITKQSDGTAMHVMETQESPIIATQDQVIQVETMLTLEEDHAVVITNDYPLVKQQFQYRMPEAGQVYLVWGIKNWLAVPKPVRPVGTLMEKGVMHTPMVRRGGTFVADVQCPSGLALNYGFLITRKSTGAEITPVWDGNADYHSSPTEDGVIEVNGLLELPKENEWPLLLDVGVHVLVGLVLTVGIGLPLTRVPGRRRRSEQATQVYTTPIDRSKSVPSNYPDMIQNLNGKIKAE